MGRLVGITSVIRLAREMVENDPVVDWTKEILSSNRITGASLNFPIYKTCKPTKVCSRLCYAGSGAISWSRAVAKQVNNLLRCQSNPRKFAMGIVSELNRKKVDYLRWNGVGDIFPESIEALDIVSDELPHVNFWVVTRIPELADKIPSKKNIFVHHSLDKTTIEKFEELAPKNKNTFFSYQCDKGEKPVPKTLKKMSVIFFDDYKPSVSLDGFKIEQICPLNYEENKVNLCSRCKRCFNGEAVKYRKKYK